MTQCKLAVFELDGPFEKLQTTMTTYYAFDSVPENLILRAKTLSLLMLLLLRDEVAAEPVREARDDLGMRLAYATPRTQTALDG